jgi:hypothetical protein
MPGKLFGPDNHLSGEGIALVVDALRLDRLKELPVDIQTHVEECLQCKQSIVSLYDLVRDEKPLDVLQHPYFGPRAAAGGTIYRIAAALAIVLAGSAIVLYLSGQRPVEETAPPTGLPGARTAPAESSTAVVPREKQFAGRFLPSNDLEGLVGGTLRSSSVEVTSPRVGEEVAGEVRFSWHGGSGPEYTLEVLTNQEARLHSVTVRESRFVFEKKLEPGLYYWKLVDGGELVYVGKFFVRR